MLALLAAVAALVATLLLFIAHADVPSILLTLALAFLSLHLAYPWTPWRRTA